MVGFIKNVDSVEAQRALIFIVNGIFRWKSGISPRESKS